MLEISVTDVLPHSGKMILIDRIIEFDSDRLVSEVCVDGKGLFGNAHTVPSWLGIEYMAQSIAALDGIIRRSAEIPLYPGYLLGTRRYHCNVTEFIVGTALRIEIKRIMENNGLAVFDSEITGDNIKINANLNVYQPNGEDNRAVIE